MSLVLVLLVVLVAVLLLATPLYRSAAEADQDDAGGQPPVRQLDSSGTEELEAARDAKLREIRETELDWRTGKLSEDDWRLLDSSLRAEAARILDDLDRANDAKASA